MPGLAWAPLDGDHSGRARFSPQAEPTRRLQNPTLHSRAASSMMPIDMPTITICLEEKLKARIAAAAARSGRSSHAFILDALSDMVERSELDEELHRIADKRWAALQRTGESVAWDDAAAYLKVLAAGRKPRRPLARRPGL